MSNIGASIDQLPFFSGGVYTNPFPLVSVLNGGGPPTNNSKRVLIIRADIRADKP